MTGDNEEAGGISTQASSAPVSAASSSARSARVCVASVCTYTSHTQQTRINHHVILTAMHQLLVKVKVADTRLPSVVWVPQLIPVLGSQPAGDVSHNPGGRLPVLSAMPAVTPATFKRAAINFAAS